jgi:hypothetical protein
MSNWHAVYYMRAGDRVKIGWSTWPEHRVKQLHGELLGYQEYTTKCHPHCWHERDAQARWLSFHLTHEWFRADPELLTWISKNTYA